MQLILLSPAQSLEEAPVFLQRLAYPIYFHDLVVTEARAKGIDPLLLFALIRQESVFEERATSRSDARGLTQIIPKTGNWIAAKLGWEGYRGEHLYRPYLNVKFGVWYLSRQLREFDGDIFAALAAYNGGPTNAKNWLRIGGGDNDLFVEGISKSESQLYVKRIYEHYAVYLELYGVGSRVRGDR
jgi:soluble lytic murein transglycosylase